jgi:polysaccharide export outer membrane protein
MKWKAAQSMQVGIFLLITSSSLMGQAPSTPPASSGDRNSAVAKSSPQLDPIAGRKAHDDSFIIGNDDVLAISVWKESELSKSVPVRSDGKISLPLMGEVQAAGRTPLQLEIEISNKLKNYITAPEVSVIVEQINSKKFNVLGMVAKPGAYSLGLPLTVMDAIALAGGFRDFAKTKDVYILRQRADGSEYRIPFNYKDFIKGKNPAQNVRIEPKDTIIIP